MNLRRLMVGCCIGFISGCSGNRLFQNDHIFASESLELRRDGTFEYSSVSDEIGSECLAQGKWRNERRSEATYVVLEADNYRNGHPDNCERIGFKRYGLWLVADDGIVQVSGELIRRRRR